MNYKIKPFPKKKELKFKEENIKISPNIDNSKKRMFTLSYRINGLTLGLIAAGIYCYYFLGYWSIYVLIIAPVLGYFIGWFVGMFSYTKK